MTDQTFTCPRCGMTSHNPNDLLHGYCGNCHDYTAPPAHERFDKVSIADVRPETEEDTLDR